MHSDRALAEAFIPQLEDGESIVWAGKSSADSLLMRLDWWTVLAGFAMLLAGLLGVFIQLVRGYDGHSNVPWMFISIGLIVFGVWLSIGRYVQRRGRALKSAYAVTDRRVIVAERAEHGIELKTSEPFADDPRAKLRREYEGRGTITIGGVKLFNVDDADEVFELIAGRLAGVGTSAR